METPDDKMKIAGNNKYIGKCKAGFTFSDFFKENWLHKIKIIAYCVFTTCSSKISVNKTRRFE